MSQVPQPHSTPFSSSREGTLSAIGTVSMCPARITRSARPRFVRATTLLPYRSTVRCGRARSAVSIASASGFSSPLTDGKSTSRAVSAAASRVRSSVLSDMEPTLRDLRSRARVGRLQYGGRRAPDRLLHPPTHPPQPPLPYRGGPRRAARRGRLPDRAVRHRQQGWRRGARCVRRRIGDRRVRTSSRPEQAANAATISAVGTSRGMPERAVTIALATALQESGAAQHPARRP